MWLFLYVVGLIVGIVGVFSLVKETWLDIPKVRLITYVFGGICGGIIVFVFLGTMLDCEGNGLATSFVSVPIGGVTLLVVLGVFYSDWILAAIAGNMAGVPSSDVALLYWLYFAFKRFPLFSF
jgi:hypothetical protein